MISSLAPTPPAEAKPAGNDLAEDGNICRNAEGGLRTAHAKTEAGNDFVHNQQDTVLVTQFANLLMIAKLHGNTAGILTDGFYDEGSGAAVFFIFLKTLLQRVDVVDHHGAGILQRICGDSDCEGRAGVDGANVVDDMIAPAVIAALQLDDFVLAGKCARQSQRDMTASVPLPSIRNFWQEG